MTNPLVSIVIPCRNAERWIADAIQSALSQTYSPIEVIVIDDGSSDSSRQIIESFSDDVVFEFLEQGGAPRARNKGWKLARGEYIHFLDADDILFPSCVKRKMELALSSGADIVYSGGFFYNLQADAGNYERQVPPGKDGAETIAHVIASTIVTTLLLCTRKSCQAVKGFDEELVKGQEHDLLFRMSLGGFNLAYLPEPLSLNRTGHNPDSITSLTLHNPYPHEYLLRRFEERLRATSLWTPSVRAALACRFYRVGVEYLATGNRLQSAKLFQHATKLDQTFVSYLTRSRRWLVPICGAYLAERFLATARGLFPRSS